VLFSAAYTDTAATLTLLNVCLSRLPLSVFNAFICIVNCSSVHRSCQMLELDSCSFDSLYNSTSHGRIDGWVGQPNFRGTFDILWTCLFTVFISTYTILCLNLPTPKESAWHVIGRKLFWMGLSIAGPEFVLTYASGQWGTAQDSVEAFRASGYPQWTLRHGFFADMGGFLLVPRDSTPFPITAKHLHWLVSHNYLRFPEISKKELWDKSKQDTIAKGITCFQISYLILQCIGRAAQHLAITTLELSALAIVACSIITSLCWLRKPVDVMTPIKLYTESSTDEILREARETASRPYRQTPLDFVDDLGPSWALNVQPFMHLPVGPFERPIPRFGNDRLPNLRGHQETLLCVTTLTYAAIHLAGWNYAFPTKVELILWRASSMFLFANTVAFWLFETAAAWYRAGRWQRLFYRITDPGRLAEFEASRCEREENRAPKQLPLPWEFWSIFPLAITYAAARSYLVVEVFLGLRSLESSAYINVDWSSFIPHV
jgi:hypothetical protein